MHQTIRILATFITCKQGQETQVINFCFSCGGGGGGNFEIDALSEDCIYEHSHQMVLFFV